MNMDKHLEHLMSLFVEYAPHVLGALLVLFVGMWLIKRITRLSAKAMEKRNLDISLEKYKLGNITPLEIREAQRNYLDAQSKFFAAQYQSKSAEIMLKEITGSIDIQ